MKTYLFVPYEEKDEAKRLGARWDAEQKKWYVPDGLNVEPFSRWLDREVHTSADPICGTS
jgi:putative DNA primase/helicase